MEVEGECQDNLCESVSLKMKYLSIWCLYLQVNCEWQYYCNLGWRLKEKVKIKFPEKLGIDDCSFIMTMQESNVALMIIEFFETTK